MNIEPTREIKKQLNQIKLFNFSDIQLSAEQISILTLNCKFCPALPRDHAKDQLEVAQFCRKLRLAYHFRKNQQDSQIHDDSICSPKSSFSPPNMQSFFLDKIIDYMELPSHHQHTQEPSPLSKDYSAIRNVNYLLRRNAATMVKADKGGALIILRDRDYLDLVNVHLSDSSTYLQLASDSDSDVIVKISNYVKDYEDELTASEKLYLLNHKCTASSFYVLPKLHKSTEINRLIDTSSSGYLQCPFPTDLKSRPIVASSNAPTSQLSHLIDIIIKPLLTKVKSHIKDSFNFLNKIDRTTSSDDILVSIDAVSLYTSIPNELGYEAIAYWVNTRDTTDRFSASFIINGLRLILENNTFRYKNSFYRQIAGVAMGTKMAPTYAILTLGYLEVKLYDQCRTHFGDSKSDYIINNLFRFIDDIFIKWPFGKELLDIFFNTLNSLNSSMKFEISTDATSMPFLDILLYKEGNRMKTDIYHKPTDSFNYLPFNSHHPRHVIRNIPYCLSRRIKTIVSDTQVQQKRLQELAMRLQSLHYPKPLINDAINKTYSTPQASQPQPEDYPLTYVSTFNRERSANTCSKMYEIIQNHPTYSHVFNKPIVRSYIQPTTLLKLCTQRRPRIAKCGRARCKTCPILITTSNITSENGKLIEPNSSMTCTSSNIIYFMKCGSCTRSYIGESKLCLSLRTNLHRNHIKNPESAILKVSKHIHSCSPNGAFFIFPIYQLKTLTSEYVRRRLEAYFITLYSPSLNASDGP